MKTTYQDIFNFNNTARGYLVEHEKENTKFAWALHRMVKRAQTVIDDYNEKVQELNIEHCSVDEKGNILENGRGGYTYTKDALLKRNKAQNDLTKQDVEIEPYMAKDVPELKFNERLMFEGFVIPKEELTE
jgi:hypothetical protein